MSVTLEVSNALKSKDSIALQPLNIPPILVTFEVSKEDRSRDFKEKQFSNIATIEETLEVSTFDKLTLSSKGHSANK